jgi:hypothetical protein
MGEWKYRFMFLDLGTESDTESGDGEIITSSDKVKSSQCLIS